MVWSAPSTPMPVTNERSILISSIGRWRRYESDEYPVPKSSIESLTPSADSSSSTAVVRLGLASIADSVSLEAQEIGLELPAGEQLGDLAGKLEIEQVARREVHRDRDLEALVAPGPALAQRLVQHVQRERPDQARLLRHRDEGVWIDHASRRMRPAHERLDRPHLAVREHRLGLVVQHQLVLVQGTAELAHDREARVVALVGSDLVEVERRVLPLGAVHRDVGALDQQLGRVAVIGEDRDPDRRLDRERKLLDAGSAARGRREPARSSRGGRRSRGTAAAAGRTRHRRVAQRCPTPAVRPAVARRTPRAARRRPGARASR